MKYLLLLAFTFAFSNIQAATLECETLINLDAVARGAVSTVKNLKLAVSQHSDAAVFVTETGPESFLVEAFLPSLQMRIYAEGSLRHKGEKLTASAWTRELMLDVVCQLK